MQNAQPTCSEKAALALALLCASVAAAGCVDPGTGQSEIVDSLTTDENGVLASSQLYADGSVIGRLEAEDGTVLLTLELPAGESVADIRTQEQTIPFEVDVSDGLGPINRGMTFIAAGVLGAADVPYGYTCRDWGYFINCADGCCWLMIYKDGSGTNGGCCSGS